jgi:hypothetical protein
MSKILYMSWIERLFINCSKYSLTVIQVPDCDEAIARTG